MRCRHALTARIAAAALGVLASPLVLAASTIPLPGERLYPESFAATADGTLYVGSAGQGGVLRLAPGSLISSHWLDPGSFGSRSILGVLADERSNTLWVCSDDLASSGIQSPGSGATALKGFDLKTGHGKVSVPLPGNDPFCNDIAVAADGSVYVSESTNGRVLKLNAAKDKLEVWASDPRLADVDGIAFGADSNLYVNTYTGGGFFRIDVKGAVAAKINKLSTPRPLTHPDGMRVLSGNTFLMVEGSGKLDRVTPRGDAVKLEILKEGLLEPAALAQVGQTIWVAETQISVLFDPKHASTPKLPFDLVAVPLISH